MSVAHPSRVFVVLICMVWLLSPIYTYLSSGVCAATYRKVGVLLKCGIVSVNVRIVHM
jgi:hypothetical protein